MLFNGVVTINFIFSDTGDLQELPRIKFLSVVNSIEQKLSPRVFRIFK